MIKWPGYKTKGKSLSFVILKDSMTGKKKNPRKWRGDHQNEAWKSEGITRGRHCIKFYL